MVNRAGLALQARAHRFDAVAVRVAQEPAVVVLAVLRPEAGCPIVGVAGLDTGAVEGVDQLVGRRVERDVKVLRDGLTVGDDREISPLGVFGVIRALLAEDGEDGVVEALGDASRSETRMSTWSITRSILRQFRERWWAFTEWVGREERSSAGRRAGRICASRTGRRRECAAGAA